MCAKPFYIIGCVLLTVLSTTVFADSTRQTIIIPAEYHTIPNRSLVGVISIPNNATSTNPAPVCALVHGSGGLTKEQTQGEPCIVNFDTITDPYIATIERFENKDSTRSEGKEVAVIAVDSFASTESSEEPGAYKFCEDNSDFIHYSGSPFHPGPPPHEREKPYKIRRITIRSLDMIATMTYVGANYPQLNMTKTCAIGTSNGGGVVYLYSLNDLGDNITAYLAPYIRSFETQDDLNDRIEAFEDFPSLSNDLALQINNRPQFDFVIPISADCYLRDMYNSVDPHDADFNPPIDIPQFPYPVSKLFHQIGTNDDVPHGCYESGTDSEYGLRERQARAVEIDFGIGPVDSNYMIKTYDNGDHDLLRKDQFQAEILADLDTYIEQYLFPEDLIFGHGFEQLKE